MTSQFPSIIVNTGPSWQGFDKLTFLVVFGASYCDVGYSHRDHPAPSADEPLGIKFPGVTFAEAGQPNWVGHLVREFAASNKSASPLVYNYAYGGSRVHDVRFQIQDVFVPHIGRRLDGAKWKAENTLFITWVGINDAAWGSDHGHNLEKLFEAQQTLFDCGARNFMFVNVPPIDRAPANGKKPNYIAWNVELQSASLNFAKLHPDATVLIYSAYDTFNAILDDPVAYGFAPGDAAKAGGPMWVDQLHPSSKVHGFVARDMMTFLTGIEAS